MDVCTLDSWMRINYHKNTLFDREVNAIIDTWKRCGNTRMEL